jgi:flavin-binding protein dodecin
MPDKTYKLVEIVGVSDESVQQAVRNALTKASQTLRNIDWFEVSAIRGWVRDNHDPVFQVQVKVGFRLLDRSVLHGSDGSDDVVAPAGKTRGKASAKARLKGKGKRKKS